MFQINSESDIEILINSYVNKDINKKTILQFVEQNYFSP